MTRLPVFLIAILAGCAATPPSDTGAGLGPPFLPGSPIDLIEKFSERDRMVQEFRARVDGESEKGSFEGIMILSKPDRFRFQASKRVIGAKLFDLAVSDGSFTFWVPRRGHAVVSPVATGPDTGPFPIRALLWAMFHSRNAGTLSVEAFKSPARRIFQTNDGGQRSEFELDPTWSVVTRQKVYDPEGNQTLSLTFSDYRLHGDIPWPDAMTLERPDGTGRMSLRFTEITFNPSLDDSLFELRLPRGVTIYESFQDLPGR